MYTCINDFRILIWIDFSFCLFRPYWSPDQLGIVPLTLQILRPVLFFVVNVVQRPRIRGWLFLHFYSHGLLRVFRCPRVFLFRILALRLQIRTVFAVPHPGRRTVDDSRRRRRSLRLHPTAGRFRVFSVRRAPVGVREFLVGREPGFRGFRRLVHPWRL